MAPKKSAREIEQDKMVAEVNRDVQVLHFLSIVPHHLFTFALFLLIPTVWFHFVFGLTDGAVALSLVAWFAGVPAALFAGRLVPEVPLETVLSALGGKVAEGTSPNADRFAYLVGDLSDDESTPRPGA